MLGAALLSSCRSPSREAALSATPPDTLLAGVARVRITPPLPFWLSGYAARTKPADGVLMDIWAKALALRDAQGSQLVIVTTDLVGIPSRISEEVGRSVERTYGIRTDRLLLSCSHTHSGPVLRENLAVMYALGDAEDKRIRDYSDTLTSQLVTLVGEALRAQKPARLSFAQGEVGFAVNRRAPSASGFRIGVNPSGPTDHSVPVLRVTGADGSLYAVLFAYACHNTTLGAPTLQVNGDYAGFAQAELERAHPGTTALFMMLCGGDQNPNPRGTVELAQQHGKSLASAVDRVLAGEMKPVRAPLRAARETVSLAFAPHTRADFEKESTHADKFRQRRASLMLGTYDRGAPVRTLPFPIQAFRFGEDLTLLALGGEVVIDYALRAKREYGAANLVVAGYCNDVMCYIPSLRVLKEGGYEANDSMIYYGMPGPFAEDVEERLFAGIRTTLGRVGITRPRNRPLRERGRRRSQPQS